MKTTKIKMVEFAKELNEKGIKTKHEARDYLTRKYELPITVGKKDDGYKYPTIELHHEGYKTDIYKDRKDGQWKLNVFWKSEAFHSLEDMVLSFKRKERNRYEDKHFYKEYNHTFHNENQSSINWNQTWKFAKYHEEKYKRIQDEIRAMKQKIKDLEQEQFDCFRKMK